MKVIKTRNKKVDQDFFENDDMVSKKQPIHPAKLVISFIVGFGVALIILFFLRSR